jgi:hypothetical protein
MYLENDLLAADPASQLYVFKVTDEIKAKQS